MISRGATPLHAPHSYGPDRRWSLEGGEVSDYGIRIMGEVRVNYPAPENFKNEIINVQIPSDWENASVKPE